MDCAGCAAADPSYHGDSGSDYEGNGSFLRTLHSVDDLPSDKSMYYKFLQKERARRPQGFFKLMIAFLDDKTFLYLVNKRVYDTGIQRCVQTVNDGDDDDDMPESPTAK